jgi:hypothetical protein
MPVYGRTSEFRRTARGGCESSVRVGRVFRIAHPQLLRRHAIAARDESAAARPR